MVNGLAGEVIGIDLGGAAIKLGRFGPEGDCRAELTLATPQPATPGAVVAAIVAGINQIDPGHQTRAIGLGTPGPADAAGRVARVAINLEGWQDVPIADLIEAQTNRPTIVANAANCAGLGEAWLGAGRAFQDVVLLTLRTGVGGAIILNGQLFVGRQGNPDGPPCNSGNRGSLEQYCAVQAIQRTMCMTPAALYDLARAGDHQTIVFWQHYGAWLGAGLSSLIYVLTPEVIILGGGISAAWEFFLPATQLEVEKRVLPSSRQGLQILIAELGNRAGMVGAARLAWQRLMAAAPGNC